MKKILFIHETKEIYQKILLSMNEIADVTWAKCFDEASNLLKEKEFSLLIMDIELTYGNENEFCSQIQHSHPETPVLYIKKYRH